MKAKIFLGGALVALVLGMTACSVDEVVQSNPVMDTDAIVFKATLGHSTRATAVTSNNLHEFSVWGWNDNGMFMDHALYYYTHDAYECDDLYLWPQAGANFIALIPTVEEVGSSLYLGGEVEADDVAKGDTNYTGYVAEAGIDPEKGITEIKVDTPADNADQIDLCYAVAMDNEPNSFVTLNFRHALSQIVFKAVNTNSDMTVDISGVSLHSISKTGKYTLPAVDTTPNLAEGTSTSPAAGTQGTWAVGSPYKDSKFSAGMVEGYKTLTADRESLLSDSGALFLIPQKTDKWDVENDASQSKGGAYFLINCRITEFGSQLWPATVGEFGEVAIPVDIDWEEGYRYTYTFIFGYGAGYYPPDDPNKPGDPIFSLVDFTVTVDEFQDAAGDYEVSTDTEDYEDGSLSNPYSVATAIRVIEAGSNTADMVYVKGIVSEISEITPLLRGVTAGHATYYISDDGETDEQLMVFDGLSLGGVEFTSSDEIAVGDEIVVYGVLDKDEDDPAITESIIYSLNGYLYDPEGELIYGNDFDATVVTSNTPITESVTAYQNEKGSGIENVTYGFSGTMSVRTTSESTGYYRASGDNNIFFGGGDLEYFIIKDITLPEGETDFKLAFGAYESDAEFSHDAFKVYVSEDNISWVQLTYKFDNGDQKGVWDWATTKFTVPEGTEKLSIYYESDAASVYRIDDVRFTVGLEAGTAIDFSTGVELEGGDKVEEPEGELIYGNDFDATVVSGNTTITESVTAYQNEEGSGIETVTYGYSGVVSVRTSSASTGYTDASGNNNIFFGTGNNYFIIKDITLPTGETDFKLVFGAYESSTFDHDNFKVYISEDKLTWVEVSYEFPDGDKSSTWAVASTTFTVPSGTEMLSIYYEATKASVYRIDDVRFTVASEAGTAIDFSTGVELDGGDQEVEEHVMVGDGTLDNPYTAADAIALVANDSSYDQKVYITGIVSEIGELNSSYNELDYYLSDDGTTANQLYVYNGYGLNGEKIYSADYLKLGDELVIYGELKDYYGTAEVNYGSTIISINGETGSDTGDIVDATAAEVNAGTDGTTYRVAGYITSVTSTTYGNFYLKDYTDQTYIYGTLDANGNTKNWGSLGISAGDIVKVHGPKSTYGSTAELVDVTVDEHYPVTDVTIADFNAASVSTEVYYRLTGTVTSIASGTYGNLYLEDETASVYVYGLPCGYGGSDNTFSSTGVEQGDVITIVGTRGVYNGTIEVLNGFYVETVSKGSGTGGDSGKGTAEEPYTVAEALSVGATSSEVYVKGIISRTPSIYTSGGDANYYISDDGTENDELYIYWGYGLGGEAMTSGYISKGDEVVVCGKITLYNGTLEMAQGNYLYSLNGSTSSGSSGDTGGTGDLDSESFVQNVTWSDISSSNSSYNEKAYINGGSSTVDICRVGKSGTIGHATCTIPTGTKSVQFYCIAWNNGGPAPFTVTVGTDGHSYEATAHSGLANNSPYTISDITSSDYFEITFDSALTADTTVTVETTSASKPRVAFIGFKYITD